MAVTKTQLSLRMTATISGAAGDKFAAPGTSVVHDIIKTLAGGTGASQADMVGSDIRSLAASANEDIDFAGGVLTNPVTGQVQTFAKIKYLVIEADVANTNSVIIKPAAATGWLGPFGAATHTLTLPPGGFAILGAPVNGWAVGAGATDLFNVANSAAGSGVNYTITAIGTSA